MFRRAVEIDFDPIDYRAGINGVDLEFVAAGIEHLKRDGSNAGVAQHVVAPFVAAADGGLVEDLERPVVEADRDAHPQAWMQRPGREKNDLHLAADRRRTGEPWPDRCTGWR